MMNPLYNVCHSMCRSTGFVLMAAALSLGAISGCGSNNDSSRGTVGSDGGLEAVDPNAGVYPSIQVIQPFLSGAVDPIKVQYWDQTYYWGPDSDGNDACFKGTVGIEVSPDLAQETLSGQVCPTSTDPVDGKTSLGQVAPCNPDATPGEPYEVASGAVQPAIAGCERGGAPCTDILVPDITDEVTCESMVRMADPIAAGAAWFQNIDAPGTKGGEASHWWYGTRAGKSFDAEDGYGGTQIDYISDATNINIVATGGGSDDPGINNIYLCSDKDVVNPAENPDVCTLSSLFGSCDKGDLKECKINNIGLIDGAYNIYIRSATPSDESAENVFGKSLGEWMKLYWISRLGGDTEYHGKKVSFVFRNGARSPDPERPSVYVSERSVTLQPGEKFLIPGPTILGQRYLSEPDDVMADAPAAWFTDSDFLVKLDGKVVIDSDVDNLNQFYYFQYFPSAILYNKIEDNGAIGDVWVTGLGALHGSLRKGEHTLTVYSEMALPLTVDLGPGATFLDTYYITVE
jgi:hypothetical protein